MRELNKRSRVKFNRWFNRLAGNLSRRCKISREEAKGLILFLIRPLENNTIMKRCCYCGKEVPVFKMSVDHKMPLAFGGKTEPWNITLCCKTCNRAKGDLSAEVYTEILRIAGAFSERARDNMIRRLAAGGAIFSTWTRKKGN